MIERNASERPLQAKYVVSISVAIYCFALLLMFAGKAQQHDSHMKQQEHNDYSQQPKRMQQEQQEENVLLGPPGNECTDGREKVTTQKACKKARKALVLADTISKRPDYNGKETDSDWPSGCYSCENVTDCTDGIWFNKAGSGSANGDARPLCALPTWSGCRNGAACGNDDDYDDTIGVVNTLLAGDSDIEYWPSWMWKDAFPADAVNEGVGGRSCATLSTKINKLLTKHNNDAPPQWVVLVCGENDLGDHGTVSKAFASFKDVVNKILLTTSDDDSAYAPRVLYFGTKPEPSTKSLHKAYRLYDKRIRKWAAELASSSTLPPLVMVDSYKSFQELGNPRNLYSGDKLHLSNKGYRKWTDWGKAAIANADSTCTVWQKKICTQNAGSSKRVTAVVSGE